MDDTPSAINVPLWVCAMLGFVFFLMDEIVIKGKLNGETAIALVVGLAILWFFVVMPWANAWGKGKSQDVYEQKEADVDTSENSVWDKVE